VGESEAVAWFFSRVVWFGGVVRCFLLLCGSAAVVPARRVWGSLVGVWIEGPLSVGWSRYFFLRFFSVSLPMFMGFGAFCFALFLCFFRLFWI
jgi:hypothetical protein